MSKAMDAMRKESADMLRVEQLSVRYGEKIAVDGLSFRLEAGQWLMLVGPNGAGKTTLLSAIAQSAPYSGRVLLDGKDARRMPSAQLARRIGVLSQQHHVGYAYTVEEIVNLGRYAHRRGFLSRADDEGEAQVERALRETGMDALRHQSVLALSGGEVQRAFLAQVLAQNPAILLLDEPANHLDLPYQRHIFGLVQTWLGQPGRAVISVVHDLSLARRYGTHAVLMNEGRRVAYGTMRDVLTPERLKEVYGMDVCGWMRELLGQWKDEKIIED